MAASNSELDNLPLDSQSQRVPTILVVDDSITVRQLLAMSFEKGGYQVETARDGRDAWEKLQAGLPCELIFCDIEMPRMDGLELLEKLQQDSRFQAIPVVIITSRGTNRMSGELPRARGAIAYRTKPYVEAEFLDLAARILRGDRDIPFKLSGIS